MEGKRLPDSKYYSAALYMRLSRDDDGDSEICPCAFVMLMSDGKIEPFVFATDKDIERIANKGHTGFTGFVPTK